MKSPARFFIVLVYVSLASCQNYQGSGIKLRPGVKIVVSGEEAAPVRFAVSILQRDLKTVFGSYKILITKTIR